MDQPILEYLYSLFGPATKIHIYIDIDIDNSLITTSSIYFYKDTCN